MAEFKMALKKSDLPNGRMKGVFVNSHEVLLSNLYGKVYAIGNRCGHMNYWLSKGKLKDKIVECPLHHAKFDVTTGKVVKGAKHPPQFMKLVKMGRMLAAIYTKSKPKYEVKVRGDYIYVKV